MPRTPLREAIAELAIAIESGELPRVVSADESTLDAIRYKYAAKGKNLTIIGLDGASLERLDRMSGRLGSGH